MTEKQIRVSSFANGVMKVAETFRTLSDADKQELGLDGVAPVTGPTPGTAAPVAGAGDNKPPVGDGEGDNKPPVVEGFVLPDNFDSMTVDELKKFAADNNVDISDVTLKDDIKAKIKSEAKEESAE